MSHPSGTLADKTASVMGDRDMPHTYTFVPDIGEKLVRLGERDDALGRVWHLPSLETRTTSRVTSLVYQTAGTAPGLKVTPAWQMRRSASSTARSARCATSSTSRSSSAASPAETELGLRATSLADAVEQTVRRYRAQAIPSSAAESGRQPVAHRSV